MDYAILLSFDIQADEQIRQLAQALVDGGVNATYLSSGLRPHLTLAEFNTDRISDVRDCLKELVGQNLQPIEIKFASVGFFPGECSVIFLSPIIDEQLLSFHRQINGALEPLCESFSPLYREENWVPHCTVALELDVGEFAAAGAVLVSQFKPMIALAFRLSIVSCCPYNEESVYYLPTPDAHGLAATQSFLAQTDLPDAGE
jgi:2'-5' RNA ligase